MNDAILADADSVTVMTDHSTTTTLGELDPALAYKARILVPASFVFTGWVLLRSVAAGEPRNGMPQTYVYTSGGSDTLTSDTPVQVLPLD